MWALKKCTKPTVASWTSHISWKPCRIPVSKIILFGSTPHFVSCMFNKTYRNYLDLLLGWIVIVFVAINSFHWTFMGNFLSKKNSNIIIYRNYRKYLTNLNYCACVTLYAPVLTLHKCTDALKCMHTILQYCTATNSNNIFNLLRTPVHYCYKVSIESSLLYLTHRKIWNHFFIQYGQRKY